MVNNTLPGKNYCYTLSTGLPPLPIMTLANIINNRMPHKMCLFSLIYWFCDTWLLSKRSQHTTSYSITFKY